MSYHISTIAQGEFDGTVERVKAALADQGFGVVTEINMQQTMKAKLDKDIPPYRILGACNPPYAFQALGAEPRIGTMLPCNVVVREISPGQVEISAVDPVASMMAIENAQLAPVAKEIRTLLEQVIASL